MTRWIVLLSVFALVGCATTTPPKQTYLPDGRHGYVIDCSGHGGTWSDCFRQAGDLCSARGYAVVAQEGDTGYQVGTPPYGAYNMSVQTRSLIIACNP
jgi:uncharacterized lipoprotein YmbA